ncbi:sigma-70 RNA polymerase sigma factor region 4 domain-containing protein [Jeotgalibacillus aurantiacus]|uniref:hypothetical protein n=1 Tax=Jeotgalibacillus aurantiacus TaxID=2763266 RepID=UPI001D0B98C6|nr:hypothetical protein [Jeotgalibacillus aurantiacus]
MQIIENYADLTRKISIIETQIEMFEVDIDFWFGKGSIPFSSKGAAGFGIETAAWNTDRVLEKLDQLRKMLEFYQEIKSEMDDNINSLDGLEYKISYMRYIENKNYKEIADQLGYSYGYIRNVVSNIKKHDNDVTQHVKKA